MVEGCLHHSPDGAAGAVLMVLMKTRCCNAYSTYVDDALCCKVCWEEVPVGEGDGGGVVVINMICPVCHYVTDECDCEDPAWMKGG